VGTAGEGGRGEAPRQGMSGERWQRVNELFHAALEREGPDREAFLRDACAEDDGLYAEVVSLIAADAAVPAYALEQLGEDIAADWAAGEARVSLVGRRIDRYHIVAHLGSGGMGDVYRATDTVLGRDVALKVLAPAFHADLDFRRRLEREARAASSLNHPNIVTVYEIGQSGPIDFVASELVDGVTLRQRLAAGPLPVRELIDIGSQVAAALSTAHGDGIVHRDIKPENVMIRRDGIVKVVDFGLAKRTGPRAEPELGSAAVVLTQAGVVAGTACYMSPEQALGEPLDHRSDLFSVGILLYEMATGQRPFTGPSDAAMYEALLHAGPPALTSLRDGLPAGLDLIVGRALEKERELRYQSAADLAADLKRLQRSSSTAPLAARTPTPDARIRRAGLRSWQTAAIAVFLLAVVFVAALLLRRPSEDAATTRFVVGPPPNAVFTPMGRGPTGIAVSVSPDGRHMLFIADESGGRGRIWMRSIDAVEARPIDDTEGASFPFWSPDGRSIAFYVGPVLKRKEIAGGPSRKLADVVAPRGGTWSREDVILFGSGAGGIFRVPAGGGTPSSVTTPDVTRGESCHRYPQFLPDGRHFLYLVGSGDTRTLFVGSLDQRVKKRLLDTTARAVYAEPGYVFFVGDAAALMARPFDPGRLELTGEEIRVGRQVAIATTLNVSFDVGGATLAYSEPTAEASQLTWFDRNGRSVGTIGPAGRYLGVRLSPDGTTAAVSRVDPATNQSKIWLVDLRRGVESRFTFGPSFDSSPVWSPDGSHVLFASATASGPQLQVFQRSAAGGPEASRLFTTNESVLPEDWSPDGQLIVYANDQPAVSNRMKLLRTRDLQSTALVASGFGEYGARISPDGHWLAYTSEESGRPEIYLRPFPAGTSSTAVSIGGGSEPSWRRDGRELFYRAPNGAVMSVPITLGAKVNAGKPSELFRARVPGNRSRHGISYATTADGQRFLVAVVIGEPAPPAITVVRNWVHAVQR
jgi:eukaryotic-like serine/threonine-protein kinase